MPGINDEYIISALETNNKISVDIKDMVIQYLKNGIAMMAMPGLKYGLTNDDKDKLIAGGIYIKTDGLWVWPSYLTYYVDHYDLNLPTDFIQNMIANNWHPKETYLK